MLELALNARRGSFHLQLECRLASEWTVVFGPSGAGKTSLLRLLAGLYGIESIIRKEPDVVLTVRDASIRRSGKHVVALAKNATVISRANSPPVAKKIAQVGPSALRGLECRAALPLIRPISRFAKHIERVMRLVIAVIRNADQTCPPYCLIDGREIGQESIEALPSILVLVVVGEPHSELANLINGKPLPRFP